MVKFCGKDLKSISTPIPSLIEVKSSGHATAKKPSSEGASVLSLQVIDFNYNCPFGHKLLYNNVGLNRVDHFELGSIMVYLIAVFTQKLTKFIDEVV